MKFPRGSNPAARRTTSGDLPRRWIDRIAIQLLNVERARDLSARLHLPVTVDASGWLSDQVEISIETRHDRTIWPLRVLVGPFATDLLLVDRGCRNYNDQIAGLRQLRHQIAALVRDDQVDERAPLAQAHAELAQLDAHIICRQYDTMGHGVVRLHILDEEVALLRAHGERFQEVVTEYVRLRDAQTRRGWSRL